MNDLDKLVKVCESISLASGSSRLVPAMNDALKVLMEIELYTSLFYTEMATWGSKKGLRGLESWGNTESAQEFSHYQDLVRFTQALMGDTKLNDVKCDPFAETAQLADLFAALHDLMVRKTDIYKTAVATAMKNEDPVSENFLYDPYFDQIGATKRSLELMNKTANMTADSLVVFDNQLANGGAIVVANVPAAD